ncbi:leukotoxin LktA family filamentous adhesin [Endozoicomonas sp. ISHI1]|uniref:leukotoxin LktA family filamentous adhesin n=1 Tax=Endozoicomonas sp. ISHI1 TaxID=2825882 RepID=UPI002149006B|nr:leukotoxin LktA family filamentous adhesin [Endozoicomonas sp. ISHI1]
MTCFNRSLLSTSIGLANRAKFNKVPWPVVTGALFSAPALAVDNDIRAVDGITSVSSAGNVHTITSGKRSNASAINVFDKFVVGTSHTANLEVPADASNLVNIVRGSDAPEVHGILNSYKNGSLGGNVVFASSAGFIVGETGVVNVGKLSIKTPDSSDITALLSGGEPVDSEVSDLLSNSFSVSSTGLVRIQGKINTASGVDIFANTIDVDEKAIIIAGNAAAASGVSNYGQNNDYTAVNVDDLTIPNELKVDGGTIVLKASSSADGAINLSGDLYADGGFTITASKISVNSGSTLDARDGASLASSGNIQFQADGNTSSALTLNGGSNRVLLQSGSVASPESNDSGINLIGSVLSDGSVIVTGDKVQMNSGSSLDAEGSVTVTAASQASISGTLAAESGISIDSKDIDLNSGSVLDTRNSGDTARGDVTLTASASQDVSLASASATTNIDFSGQVYAGSLTASAISKAASSIKEEPGVAMGSVVGGALAGASFYLMDADAEATVNVNSGANINASGNVSLASESHAVSDASAITLGNALPGALAAVYATSDATSTTHVKSGATIQAGGNLDVSAHNESYVAATAFNLIAEDANKVVIAAAVGESDVDATAKIDSGVTLDANNLVVAAENQNYYHISASAYGLKATRYGLAVAVGDFDTNATAEMGSSLGTDQDKTGNVTITALDRTLNQRVHSGVTVGSNLFMRTIGSKAISGISALQNGVHNFTTKYLPIGHSAPTDETGKVSFKGGLAFSLNLSDHDAYSFLGTNVSGQTDAPHIISTGNILVASQTDLGSDNQAVAGGNNNGALGGDQGGYRTSAESAVSAPKQDSSGSSQTPASDKSLALALNLAINDSDAVAEVGQSVQINAANLGVIAAQHMPIVSTYDKWDTFSDVVGKFNGVGGLQNNILTGFANAGAAADKEAYGGSFNVLWNDMDTKAWIGDKAKITTTGTGNWSGSRELKANSEVPGILSNSKVFKDVTYSFSFGDSVAVEAYNLMETATVAGNLGSLGLIPNATGTNEKGKSVGGSISYIQQSGSAVAGIGKATVNAAGNVGVYAETDERHFLVTPSSGQSSGIGFSGVLGFLNSEMLTHASLHNQAQLSADKLVVIADHEFGNWAAAGAFSWSDQSAVGIAIAANVSQGDTKAFIGDNSKEYNKVKFQDKDNNETDKPAPSSPTAPDPTKGIVVNSVTVRGRATGTNGSLAVAGALTTEPSDEPGIGAKFENWYNGLSSKLAANYTGATGSSSDSSIGKSSESGKNDDSGSGSGKSSAEVSKDQLGLTGAGSFTVSVNNIDAKAIIDGASISGHQNGNSYNDVDVDVQALEKVISASATGSAALSMLGANSPTNQDTIAGAISYQISFNDALAWIKDSVITYADDVNVQALHGGELTSVALALSVTRPDSSSGQTRNGALSISGAQIYDGTSARIEGSSVSSNQGANNDLEVSAYNNSYVGVGGGTLYGGGKQGAGLAITFAEINDPSAIPGDANPDGNNVLSTAYDEDVYDGAATEAIVDFSGSNRSYLNNFDRVDISARSLNRIGIGAAGIGYNNNQEDSLGFQGSFAIGSIGADTKALVKGTSITGAGVVNLNASGEKDGDLDKILSDLGSSNTNKDFDFSGAEAMDNTNVHTSEDGSGSTYSYSSEGKRIIAVAGAVQVGKKNLGISYAHADVKSETKARMEDVNINKSGTGAAVNVNARDNSLLYSVAIGVGVGTGGFSGVGSVAVNRLNNQVLAEIGDWNGSDKGTINASDLSVIAQNDMDLINVAGSVAVASGQGGATAGGLAVALNLVGTDEHSTKARISNTSLKVDEDLTVRALSGTSNNHNLLVGNAIAIGANLGQSGIGFAGAISTNNVDQSIEAGIKDTATNRSSAASSTSGGDVIVQGQDYSDSVATAWMGAGSGNGSAGGVAIATNRVDSDVTAEVLGNKGNPDSTTLKAQNVIVDAFRRNWLLTIDAGVAASKQVSLAGSVGTGVIDGNVTARIADDARIDVWNNVLVNADALSVNLVGSGAVGIGVDAGAGAVAISTAMEYGKTEAYIDDAVVIARGKGSTMQVDTGDLKGYGDLPDLSTAGDSSNPDAVSMGDLTSGFNTLSVERTKESVNGLVVNATSRTKQRAITVGGAGGKTVAINANVATNGTYNATKAYIKDATINTGVSGEDGADVYVRANAHEAGLAVSAGVAVSGGGEAAGAGVGGFATNAQKRSSEATIENSTVNADKVTIDANTSKLAQAVSAGVAAGLGTTGGLGGAASVVITEQAGNTRAWLRGGTTNAREVVVVSDRRQEANVAAGAAGIGTTVGVGVGLAVNIVGGDSKAIIGNDLDDNGDTLTTAVNSDTVTVDADRVSSAKSYVFGAGLGGGYGVAAMINTTEFRGETRAAIHGYLKNSNLTTDIRGSDGSSAATNVTVKAQELQDADQWAAGIGAGASLGVGAVANVVLGRSQVYSEVVGSDIEAGTLDIDANAQRQSSLISVAGAASTNAAAAVSIGLALYGQGDTTAEDGTNAEDEFDPSRNEANTVLATDTASYNRHLSDEEIATLEADNNVTITRSQSPSTSTTTESGKSLKLSGESVTAARISGGKIDVDTLNVNGRTLQHSYQGLGAAQVSSVGIAGVVGISRSYEMNIATVDSNVKANNAVIGASLENASSDDGALEMKSFIVGLGGTSVVINYTDARSENRVVAGISSAEGNDTGDLEVTATDSTDIRLGDVSSGKPSSVTDGSLNVNIGAGAVGVSVGYAEKDSDIDVWVGETGKLIDGYNNITVSALNQGMVKSTGFALAGGLLAGVQGVVTYARDDSDVKATVYGTIDTGSDSSVVIINAQSASELYSSAYGVTVAAGGSMGGSFAYAIADTKAEAEVADGTVFNGSGDVIVRSETGSGADGYESAYAAAFAASGGLLLGVAGSEARATNKSQSIARVGDGVYLPYSDFTVNARHTGVQIADADGYFVGLVAGGYQTGVAQSFTSSRVEFGKNPIAALERPGDLTLDATSYNQNQSFTTAGGGGYYSGSAAESVMDAGDHSNGHYSAAVEIDDWSGNYRIVPVDAGGVYISASSETEFFAGTDATTVSVVGGSGATSLVEVDTNAKVDLGENVSFSALDIDIDAFNSAYQIQNPYFNGFTSSIHGAGGGAANGTAGLSYQDLKNIAAEVVVGKNAVLKISDLAWMDSTYDHNIMLDANTDFFVYDESKLEIGGALQGAGAESDVDVKTRNKISLGEGAELYNPRGEIGIGTYSRGSAVSQANVTVWAAAGVAGGVSTVDLDVLNQIDIGKNAVINGYGNVGIYSGRGSNYFQENQLTGNALANVYNWTAIPIPAGNKAKSNITLNNKVNFADGFDIGSDSHVFIEANEGQVSSTHRGIEKNPYLELFSSETSFGSSDSSTSNVLTFNGNGKVVAGQYAYQWVEIESDGTINKQLYRYGTAARMNEKYSSRAELAAYIKDLQDRVDLLESWDGSSILIDGVTVSDGDGEDTGSSSGTGSESIVDGGTNPYQDEINELKSEIVLLSAIVNDLSANPNDAIRVADVQATAGNINLVADTITLAGSNKPTFTAKGDAYIKVENKTDEHLLLENLSITNQTGGNVFVTGGGSLGSSYIFEQSGSDYTTKTGIDISHAPTGANYLDSDVIINGDISNLLSSVNIDVAEGDLIQQATIEANAINLNVENGSLLLNSNKPQTYGRDPKALVNYTAGWKPSAEGFVQLYLNDKYSTAINATGINDFNNWFTGRAIRHTGDQKSYYQGGSYGYDEMNIYFNWGFSDSKEYNGSDAVVFEMRSNSSSRGGSKWKFKPVQNLQSKLEQSATYSQVKSSLGGTGTSIIGEKVVINAERLDINGKIIVGTDNSWSVDVGSGFDATIAEYISDAGLSAGDVVNIRPGETKALWVRHPSLPGLKTLKYYDFDVSSGNGTSGIGLIYDVGTGKLRADDIPVSGGGYVAIRAKISSTGEEGNITVKDGLGQIDINNDSSKQLVLGTISAGDDATGVIRITDLNKRKNGSYYSEWFVHSPGNKIRQYETDAWAVSYDESNYVKSLGGTGTTSTMTYNPMAGQLFYIREGATVVRSFDPPGDSSAPYDGKSIDGYFAKYPNTLGDWYYETNWNTETSYYTTCAYKPEACSNGTASNYLTQVYDRGGEYVWGVKWGLSYDKYYGSNMTNVDPVVYVPYRMWMDAHTYVKADNAITFQFTGSANGFIDLTSKSSIELTGNVYNPSGTTNISTLNDLITSGSTAITSDVTTIAARGSIGSRDNALAIITDELGLSSSHGSLYFNVTGADGDVELRHLKAKYDIVGVVDKGIVAKNSNTIIQSDRLDLTSSTGGIGKVGTIGNTGTYQFVNISTTGTVKLNAATDIAVNQASGDLELYSANANEEVVIKLGNGRITNGIGRLDKTDEELAYDAAVWDSLNLLDDDAGAVTVSSYENQFTHKYHTYWMIKQRLSDDSDAGFTIDPAFVEALKVRYNTTDEVELASLVKADYQGLEQWFADQVTVADVYDKPEDAIGIEQKGTLFGYDYGTLLTGSYDQDYRLTLAKDSSWYTSMVDGAKWKQSQLDISISATALNGDASSQLTNREANIKASDIHLIANGGSVGENLNDLVFSVSRDGSGTITDAQKAALLAAGAGDISTTVTQDNVTFNVKQVDPIKIDMTGELYASATKEIYVESKSGLTLGSLVSSGNDIRLVVDGAIDAKAGLTHIAARDLFIANTRGDIGSQSSAVKLNLTGALRQAGAAADMYLQGVGGDLYLGSISAGGLLSIANGNDLLSYNNDSFLSAESFNLDVNSHDLGSSSGALNLIMTGTGSFRADAGNAWLNVKDSSLFTLGQVDIEKTLSLSAVGALALQGNLDATDLTLDVDGALTSGGYTMTVGNDADIDADSIDLDAMNVRVGSANIYAQSGGLTLGDVTATKGLLTLLANGQLTLNGDIVTQGGNLLADANRIAMDSLASVTSSGNITMTASDSMNLFNLTARNGVIDLTATNGFDVQLGSITATRLDAREVDIETQADLTLSDSVATSTGNVMLTSGGDMFLNANITSDQGSIILDGQKGLYATRRIKSGQDLQITTKGNQELSTLEVGGKLDIDLEGGSTLSIASATVAGLVDILSSGDLTLSGSLAASDVIIETTGGLTSGGSISSSTGSMTLKMGKGLNVQGDISAFSNMNIVAVEGVTMAPGKSITAGGYMDINAAFINMSDNSLMKSGADMKLYTPGSMLLGTLEVGGDLDIDIESGAELAISSATVAGIVDILSSGDLDLSGSLAASDVTIETAGELTAGGSLSSSAGSMTLKVGKGLNVQGYISAFNDIDIVAAEGLTMASGRSISAGGYMDINAAFIDMGDNSLMKSGADMKLYTPGSMLLGVLEVGGNLDVDIESGSVLSIDSAKVTGTVDVLSSGDLTLSGSLAAADVKIETAGDLTAGGSISASSGAMTLKMGKGLNVQGDISSSSNMNIEAAEGVLIASGRNMSAGGNLDLMAAYLEMAHSRILSGGNMQLSTTGLMDLSELVAGGNLTLFSRSGPILFNQSVTAGGHTSIRTGSPVVLRLSAFTEPGTVNLAVGESITSTGGISIDTDTLVLGDNSRLNSGDGVTVLLNTFEMGDDVEISAVNDIDMTVQSQVVLNGPVSSSAGSIRITGTEGLDILHSLNAGQDIVLTVPETVVLPTEKHLLAGRSISVTSDRLDLQGNNNLHAVANLTLSNNGMSLPDTTSLRAGGDMALLTSGLVRLNGQVQQTGGSFQVNTDSNIQLEQDINAGRHILLATPEDVYLEVGRSLVSGEDLRIESDGLYLGRNTVLDAGGNMALINNTLSLPDSVQISAGGDFELETDGRLYLTGTIGDIGGSLRIRTDELYLYQDLNAGESIELDTSYRIYQQYRRNLVAGEDISLSTDRYYTGYRTSLTAGDDISVSTRDELDFYYVSAGGDFAVDSEYGNVHFKESVTAGGDMSVESGRSVYLSSWKDITAGTLAVGTANQSGAYRFSVGYGSTIETEGDLLVNTTYTQDYQELIVGGDFTARAEYGSIHFRDSVTAGGAVNLHSGRDIYLSAWEGLKAGSLAIGTEGQEGAYRFTVGHGSSIETGGDLFVNTTYSQDYETLNIGGNFDGRSAHGNIHFDESVTAAGIINLEAGRDIYLSSHNDLTAASLSVGSESQVGAYNFSVGHSSTINLDGDLLVHTRHDQQYQATNVGGSVNAVAEQGRIYFADSVIAAGDMQLQAGRDIDLSGRSVLSANSLTIGSQEQAGAYNFYAGYDSRIEIAGDMFVHTTNYQSYRDVTAGGDFEAIAHGWINFGGDVNVAGAMNLYSARDIHQASYTELKAGSLSVGSADSVGAYRFTTGYDSVIETAGDIFVSTTSSQDYHALNAGGDFTARAGWGDIDLGGSVIAEGAVSLFSERDISLSGWTDLKAASLTIGSSEHYGADRFSMGYDSSIETSGAVTIHTRGNQYLGSLTSHADGLAFALTSAQGGIYGNNEYRFSKWRDASHLTASNGQAVLQAATGIGHPLVVDLPWLSAETESGNINILARADLEASLLKTTGGNIYMTTLGSLSIDELVGNAWLAVGDLLFARKMTMERGSIRAESGIEVEQLSLTGRHGVSFYAPDIRVTQADDDGTSTEVEAQRYAYIKPASESSSRGWGRFF